jgi:hypothetical protein
MFLHGGGQCTVLLSYYPYFEAEFGMCPLLSFLFVKKSNLLRLVFYFSPPLDINLLLVIKDKNMKKVLNLLSMSNTKTSVYVRLGL